jgi:hypothetical protein
MAFPRSMLTPPPSTRECHAIPYQPRPHRGIEAFQNHGFRAPHVCSSHIIVTFRLVTPPWRLLVPCFRQMPMEGAHRTRWQVLRTRCLLTNV